MGEAAGGARVRARWINMTEYMLSDVLSHFLLGGTVNSIRRGLDRFNPPAADNPGFLKEPTGKDCLKRSVSAAICRDLQSP